MSRLTHLDEQGRACMVDVSQKAETSRVAVARGFVRLSAETLALVDRAATPKGNVIAIAELAGIMGAKRTADLIPLCHPLPLSSVTVAITRVGGGLQVEANVRTVAATGVEMEALTAVSAACLTIYDMLKAAERGIVIERIELVSKQGGRSGDWQRP